MSVLFPSKYCQIPFIALHGSITEMPSYKIPVSKPVDFMESLLSISCKNHYFGYGVLSVWYGGSESKGLEEVSYFALARLFWKRAFLQYFLKSAMELNSLAGEYFISSSSLASFWAVVSWKCNFWWFGDQNVLTQQYCMHCEDPKEWDFKLPCMSWALVGCTGWSTCPTFTTGFMQWLVITQMRRRTHRVWVEKKKQHFLERERKFQHYLAAMSLLQTLVQEEPSHTWGNRVCYFLFPYF